MGVFAGPGIVAVEERAHDCSTLVVTAGTLAAGTAEALVFVAARGSVIFIFVFWAGAGVSRAFLGNVAGAGAGAADGIGGCELALVAAAVVGIIAHGSGLVLAGRGVTAGVVAATLVATTVAVLAGLDDTVSALAAADRHDALVLGETGGFDAVLADGGTDISNCARRELGHGITGIWVHDVFRIGIASRRTQRAALG